MQAIKQNEEAGQEIRNNEQHEEEEQTGKRRSKGRRQK